MPLLTLLQTCRHNFLTKIKSNMCELTLGKSSLTMLRSLRDHSSGMSFLNYIVMQARPLMMDCPLMMDAKLTMKAILWRNAKLRILLNMSLAKIWSKVTPFFKITSHPCQQSILDLLSLPIVNTWSLDTCHINNYLWSDSKFKLFFTCYIHDYFWQIQDSNNTCLNNGYLRQIQTSNQVLNCHVNGYL